MGERTNEESVGNENHKTFFKNVKEIISDPEELYSCVTDSRSFEIVGSLAWELISTIMTHLKDNGISDGLLLYGKTISEIARLSPPKDIYLGILEHFDPCMESKHVEVLIPGLTCVINKLCSEDLAATAMVLETTCSTLSYYLESLNIPNYEDYQPNAKRQTAFEATKIFTMMEKFVYFLKPAVERTCINKKDIHDFVKFENHIFEFLCSLLVILAQLDLHVSELAETKDSEASEKKESVLDVSHVSPLCIDVMNMTTLFHTPLSLWNTANWLRFHTLDGISPEGRLELAKKVERGRACYLYLLLCYGVLYDRFPKVYSHLWMLVKTIPSISALLLCENQVVVWKGLEILSHILEQTKYSSISYRAILYNVQSQMQSSSDDKLSQSGIHALFQELTNIAVMLPSKTVRRKAIGQVTNLLDSFLWEDKYILLVHLLKVSQHTGVIGVLIGYVKDKLHEVLQASPPKDSSAFCEKRKMETLGELIFLLPQGAETDLLDDSDRLLPALNLLRFILIRDKANATGVFDNMSKIDQSFLKPLRSALDLSRAHYQNELWKYTKKAHWADSAENTFYVRGTPLASMPPSEQKKILISALHTFDTIKVVTIRVLELVDESGMHTEPEA